jgi:hypothetical protein
MIDAVDDEYIDELRASEFAPDADAIAHALAAVKNEAKKNNDAKELLRGWRLIAQEPTPIEERLAKQSRLLSLRGKVHIPDIREWGRCH